MWHARERPSPLCLWSVDTERTALYYVLSVRPSVWAHSKYPWQFRIFHELLDCSNNSCLTYNSTSNVSLVVPVIANYHGIGKPPSCPPVNEMTLSISLFEDPRAIYLVCHRGWWTWKGALIVFRPGKRAIMFMSWSNLFSSFTMFTQLELCIGHPPYLTEMWTVGAFAASTKTISTMRWIAIIYVEDYLGDVIRMHLCLIGHFKTNYKRLMAHLECSVSV